MQSEIDAALQGVQQALLNAKESQRHAQEDIEHWKAEALEWKARYEQEVNRKPCKLPSLQLPARSVGGNHHITSRRYTETDASKFSFDSEYGITPSTSQSQSTYDQQQRSSAPGFPSMLAATLLLHGLQSSTSSSTSQQSAKHITRTGSFADHTTVSVADDGRSGVGATAAAAVSVALAQSWAAVASRTGAAPQHDLASLGLKRPDKARFKLVAAVPRNNRRGTQQPTSGRGTPVPHESSLHSSTAGHEGNKEWAAATPSPIRSNVIGTESTMALESLDEANDLDDAQEATWRASGSHLKMHWLSCPTTVLVCYKPVDSVLTITASAISWLLRHEITVYVEPEVHTEIVAAVRSALQKPHGCVLLPSGTSPRAPTTAALSPSLLNTSFDRANSTASNTSLPGGSHSQPELPIDTLLARVLSWSPTSCAHTVPCRVADALDLVITLGGDGTVLWACSLFGTGAVPPIVPIALGSLGFMTPFPISRMDSVLERVVRKDSGFPIMLRHRLQARIMRSGTSVNDLSSTPLCGEEITVLNEVVIYRGMAASLGNLQCFVDRNFVTALQGDGLIVSTPTGSTAYNLAAGGCMVHPSVPCVLFTPICPHTLSSRPLVFPEHVTLRVKVPEDSRSDAYVSFDGKGRQLLNPGDSVLIHLSQWPVPMVCNLDASHDWFLSVREGLNWNLRKQQQGKGQ